jgi:hypothetical protein
LSKAGREVMIKFVLQVVPSYFMSIFLLPKTLIDEIEKNDEWFFVGYRWSSYRGMRWMSWDKLYIFTNFIEEWVLRTYHLSMLSC